MANLSNINNKLIITDGGNLLVNATANLATYGGITIDNFSDPSIAMKTTSASGWLWTQYVTSTGTNNFSMGVNQTIPYWCVKAGAGMDSPHLVVNSSGNVGIGITSPNTLLHLLGADATVQIQGSGTSSNAGVNFFPRDASNVAHLQSIKGVDSSLTFLTGGNSGNSYVPTEKMRIDSSGSLIVGTATVAAANAAADNFVIKGEGTAVGLTISQDSNSGTGTIFFGDAASSSVAGFRYNHNTGDMAVSFEDDITFSNNGGERMRIDSSGNVGIGVTPWVSNLPNTVIDINPVASIWGYSNSAYLNANAYYNNGWLYKSTASAGVLQVDGNILRFRAAASGTADAGIAFDVPFIVDSTGNVGIGTTSPAEKLHIRDASTDANVYIKIANDSRDWFMGVEGSNSDILSFKTHDASNLLNITSGGNVGIGTTSPQGKLDSVAPVADLTDFGRATGSALNIRIGNVIGYLGQINFCNDAAPAFGYGSIGMVMTSGSGVGLADMVFGTKSSGAAAVSTERMRITSSGNTVLQNSLIFSDSSYVSDYSIRRNANALIFSGGTSGYYFNRYNNSVTDMWIDGGGITRIGGTANLGYASHNIQLSAPSSYALIVRNSDTSTTNNSVMQFNRAETTATTGGYCVIYRQGDAATGTNRWIVFANGNIQNTNNSYGSLSDERKKENIVDATPKLDDLMKVKVRNFNLKGEETKQIGVVAQELEEVFPGMIDESKTPDSEDETLYKGVKYSVFIPMLIKAIQELKAEIELLKSK